jgi:hypothetical protein
MKKVGVIVFFDHRYTNILGDLNIPEESSPFRVILFFFDESTTLRGNDQYARSERASIAS